MMKRILITLFLIVISTILLIKAAYITRGYFAVGGEWLVWVFPLLLWVIKKEDKPNETVYGGNT